MTYMSQVRIFCRARHSPTPRHCEAPFEVWLRTIQLSVAASPKQSPCTKFEVRSVQGDCFVASHDFVPASFLQMVPKERDYHSNLRNAPRNEKFQDDSCM
jgi:hypothetical protein